MDRNRETVKTISLQRMSLITEIIASLAVVVSIPPMILFFFLQKYLVGGLSLGGVKG